MTTIATDTQIKRLREKRRITLESIKILTNQQNSLAQQLTKIKCDIMDMQIIYGNIDSALAAIDGRTQTVKPKLDPASRKKVKSQAKPRNKPPTPTPTPEDLIALINKIPLNRRKQYLEKIFQEHIKPKTEVTS